MKLTKREKSKLVLEGFVTVGLIFLLYYAVYVIFTRMVLAFPQFFRSIWILGDVIISVQGDNVISLTPFLVVLLSLIAVIVIYWRLKRRYRQMQLSHIISELHYIAEGHYDHRISHDYGGDMSRVVESIHVLVDSTVAAMEEERRIEQSKDELITNVSHDIRTPLTSIIGYLGLIEEGRYQSKEELQKYTHVAYEKAKQMKALVDDLFEYTKVRQTTTPLNLSQFDMIQLLEQLVVDFELEAAKKQMEIEIVSPLTELHMEADTEKIVRVFNNLIANALKYGKGGKQILIEVEANEKEALIMISNDGPPIPQKALSHLFDRFYRVDISRSQENGGTGLGLAIAENIVSLHHGQIEAKTEGKWTRFCLVLPLQQEQKG
ncbi:sensor histidine kinase [Pisciglobus halotolerans]|uniref:histidine kinase n=1 Tax=Pisciglobus halotolerans TaxID=745365 RepID=A0A1I3DFG2_9LACT|nr:ATP-binding protein [Pisciglobus halotolerans]SFH85455.1 His Kinase A (phospho-acceptor) domain-containing protein [Pisciglobus halotolerans]